VFCYQGGHDNRAYSHRNFQEVLRRGILWSAGRI
jgi:type 1 glutamine amidotransferase